LFGEPNDNQASILGQGWVDMGTPDDAARAVARDVTVKRFWSDGKDAWPPASSAIDPNLYKK